MRRLFRRLFFSKKKRYYKNHNREVINNMQRQLFDLDSTVNNLLAELKMKRPRGTNYVIREKDAQVFDKQYN